MARLMNAKDYPDLNAILPRQLGKVIADERVLEKFTYWGDYDDVRRAKAVLLYGNEPWIQVTSNWHFLDIRAAGDNHQGFRDRVFINALLVHQFVALR